MENLNKILDSLQEQILTLYEENSTNLTAHIRLWRLMRREQVFFYWARQQGVTRVGMRPLPSQASSQTKAKEAIEQEIYVTSLSQSRYGDEPWTIGQTSRERLLADPQYCFKKDGVQLEVRFDGDKENLVRYTFWQTIYYQDAMDEWQKTAGLVDSCGLYYVDAQGLKLYYVDFKAEAAKYSRTGLYEVLGNYVTTDVSTSCSGVPHTAASDYTDAEDTAQQRPPARHAITTPKKTSAAPPRRYRVRRSRSRSPRFSSTPTRPRGGVRGPRQRQREPRSTSRSAERVAPPSAEEVGRRHQTPSKRSGGRIARLIADARDPPVIIVKGDGNRVKCLRFRLKSKFPTFFDKISTTWTWTSSDTTDRVGSSRMLISFTDHQQRQVFLDSVPLPSSVRFALGSFDSL
ncbi:E2 [Leptonychotes weddellii papillomavirus 1]|uniref:Regulatory protein E2 n=1 Tax=Leptonychotes weddellii papillomavirus 1 TaxID=2077302 RepID=A0A2I8B2N3_9PAPI|nr:E2 [Leptonychotes weddellii papillomavirus 1]AUT11898.1 E2 [Leptonychotes weddellii papillomavirus 1]